jgi:NTE family protein
MSNKRSLVLSGGGSKGAFQIGVLRKLIEENPLLQYDQICGVSVGAINAASLGMFDKQEFSKAIDYIQSKWFNDVETKTIHKPWLFGVVQGLLFEKSLFNSSPIHEYLKNNLDLDKLVKSNVDVVVGACSLETGEYIYVNKHDRDNMGDNANYIDWICASSSFPVFFTPVRINNKLWTDGGVRSMTPLSYAIKSGHDIIDVILSYDPEVIEPKEGDLSVFDQLLRTLDLMSNQIGIADIKIAGLKNDLVELNSKYKKVEINVYCPNEHLTSNSLDFNKESVKKMFEIGYNNHRLCIKY